MYLAVKPSYGCMRSLKVRIQQVQSLNKLLGGLTRVATVLAELAEEIHFASISPKLLDYFNTPVIQRLGYLLEAVFDEQEKSNELFALAQSANRRFRKVALKTTKEVSDDCELNKRWKIMVNQEIEIDEL